MSCGFGLSLPGGTPVGQPATSSLRDRGRAHVGLDGGEGGEQVDVFLGEVVADHGDDLHGSEVAGREGDVGAGAAEHPVDFARGGGDAVVGDGPDNNK